MRRSPRVLLAWAAAVIVMLRHGACRRRRSRIAAPPRPQSRRRRRRRARGARPPARRHRRRRRSAHRAPTVDAPSPPTRCTIPRAAVGRVVAVALLRDDVVGARHLVTADRRDRARGHGGRCTSSSRTASNRRSARWSTCSPPTTRRSAGPVRGDRRASAVAVAHGRRSRRSASTASSEPTDGAGSGVTLLVTEAEARAVAYAASVGEVALALAPGRRARAVPRRRRDLE